MKKLGLMIVLIATVFMIFGNTNTYASTSNFGSKALLFGKDLTGGRMTSPKVLTDGSDSTTYNIYGETAYTVNTVLIPQAYTDMLYVRGVSAKGQIKVRLTFVDDTTETVTFPTFTLAKQDLYANVMTNSKMVKNFFVFGVGDFYISEFDMRRAEYNPSDAKDFIITDLKSTGDYKSTVLTWKSGSSKYFDHYNVYRDGVKVTEVKEATYSDQTLNEKMTYKYSVSGVDQFKQEYNLYDVSYTTPQKPPPPKPIVTLKNVDDGTVQIGFTTNSIYIKKYLVYQNGVQVGEVTGNEYTSTKLTNKVEYSYYVIAVDDQGVNSLASEVVKATPTVRPVPKPVLTATSGDSQITLSFTADSMNIKKYIVYQDDVQIAEVTGNSYVVTKLKNAKKYTFNVIAIDDRGTSSVRSDSASATPVERVLPPTNSGQTSTEDYLQVTWSETKDAVGYMIFLNGSKITQVGKDVREFKITKAMGYNTKAIRNISEVKAVFSDGAVGGGNNTDAKPPEGVLKDVGLGGAELWDETMNIIFSLFTFILLGLAVRMAPKIIRLVQEKGRR